VLVSRNLEKLEEVAREISRSSTEIVQENIFHDCVVKTSFLSAAAKFNVQTKIIAIDLSKMGFQNIPQMREELKDLDIALLGNYSYFHLQSNWISARFRVSVSNFPKP
jgi:short-subunit dehydrogenase